MTDQSPVEGGEISGDGMWLRGSLEWWLNDKWSVIFRAHHLAMTNDFKGPSNLRDTLTVPGEELTYDVLKKRFSVGVWTGRWLGTRLSLSTHFISLMVQGLP